MDGSILFYRWRQCDVPCGYTGVTWRIGLNLCVLLPTRIHNPNGKSIDSAVFGRPFVYRFALFYRTDVCPVCFSCLSVTLVYCGQTAGWIKMPLGTEVNLSPGHTVLDGDPAPSKGAQQPPSFRPLSIMAKRSHIGATWRIRLKLCFIQPTRVHNPSGISIGSAVFAPLTAESPYIL